VQNNDDRELLENDLKQGESLTVEFKEDIPQTAKKLADDIASFATSNGGRIYIYINATGKITPNPPNRLNDSGNERDKFQRRIRGIVNMITPAFRVEVTFIEMDSGTIARIDVPKGNEPVYYTYGTPYLRDLSDSRPASANEVKDLHMQYFKQQSAPNVSALEEAIEDQEVRESLVSLLFQLSDAQLALYDIEEHYANPQLNQVQYDLGTSADQILSLITQPPLKRLNLHISELKRMGEELKEMENKKFYLGKQYWDEFNSKGKAILELINPTVELVRIKIRVNETSRQEYKGMVEAAINELKTDWEMAQKYEAGKSLEKLRDSFRRYGYRFHRLANLPEADEVIDHIRAKLLKLSRQLRKLSSVEGWGISRIGFSHIEHVRSPMENNLKIADEILAVLNSA
jgi:ATP-dependent DNA helicase RecG